ncbi:MULTISPECIES: hypothetical protein [unclassified Paenibacillus]|uniref:hypothetical protein n=1 Tax=unclassified Paenibacillus TaxID=185978 RepID=UPI00020D7BAB|nr:MULTISPECIES: hypothetical protein [unclassified Paenibacillus]EGL18556.1 hypothetical protein HMPREF9413_5917 [Paenibacillus sp. HGF7]EPD80521.1 hypothetical protein HMPREF1207_05627 [Paenibacillus sp. HGH0039]
MKTRTQRILLAVPFLIAVIFISTKLDTFLSMIVNFVFIWLVGTWILKGTKED